MEMYRQTASNLSPEYVEVDLEKQHLKLPPGDARAYIMRPGNEFSLFCNSNNSQQKTLKLVCSVLWMIFKGINFRFRNCGNFVCNVPIDW
jgi:hypothetical protein